MAHGQGMTTTNIDTIVSLFEDGRDTIVGFLAIRNPTQEQKDRMLAHYDGWLRQAQKGAHASAIGRAYDRCMDADEGTQRIRKLTSEARREYGRLPTMAAD